MKPIDIELSPAVLEEKLEPVRRAVRPYKERLDEAKWMRHLKTVNTHRKLVRQYCFRLGLYRQGLMHDLSKYSPVEFMVGAKYFQGFQSPNNAERMDRGFSSAWLHHKGRNKHHFEYWIDYNIPGKDNQVDPDHLLTGMEMPVNYVVEMFCDRVAASRVYRGDEYRDTDPWTYFDRGRARCLMHPNTEELLGKMLKKLADEGEEAAFAYIREEILRR